jgi:hypothetical protein
LRRALTPDSDTRGNPWTKNQFHLVERADTLSWFSVAPVLVTPTTIELQR